MHNGHRIENDVENVGFDIAANLTDTWSVKTGFNYQDFERIDMESYPSFSNMNPDGTGTVTQGGNYRHDKWRFRTAYVDLTNNS